MRRPLVALMLSSVCLVVAAPAGMAEPPDNPSATGECASATAQERRGRPAEPGFSFPFECPPPPGIRRMEP